MHCSLGYSTAQVLCPFQFQNAYGTCADSIRGGRLAMTLDPRPKGVAACINSIWHTHVRHGLLSASHVIVDVLLGEFGQHVT